MPDTAVSIQDEEVLQGAARALYFGLSGIALIAILRFAIWWGTLPGLGQRPLSFAVASIVILYEVAVWVVRWIPLSRMRQPRYLAPAGGLRVAAVTTIVPGQEPVEMLEQTLPALIALHGPHDTWVLDEGDDPTVRALCARLGAHHATRKHRPEYQTAGGRFAARSKHGNYNFWLAEFGSERYDVLAAFDTDHVPEAEYLERTLGYLRDTRIGYVQPPQVYYNQNASFIAQGAAEETYAYYSSHQMASYALGHPIVLGSHGVHRISALLGVGGFPDHDAEDLYLTLRYRSAGWRGVHVPEILALGTTPVDWRGYLVQQMRWARSVLDLKRAALRRIAGPLPLADRLISLFHGVYFLRPLLWLLLFPMLIGLLINNAVPVFLRPPQLIVILGMAALLRGLEWFRQWFYLDPERERGSHWRAALLLWAKWPHFAGALLDALLARDVPYALTPKVGGGAGGLLLAPLHLGLGCAVALAWLVGRYLHPSTEPILTLLATLVIAISVGLALTEVFRFPPPFDPTLLPARRALLVARRNRPRL